MTAAHQTFKSLTLVCPVLNEEEVVSIFVESVTPYLVKAVTLMSPGATYEILFVDDGSTDSTPMVIAQMARSNPAIKLVRLSRNFGKEAALAAGLKHSSGDAVIPIDVDLQDPPDVILQMVEAWKSGAKVVNAKRVNRDSDGWMKRQSAALFYRAFNKIARRPIPPNVGDYRLLDREVVNVLNQFTEKNRFMKLIFSWVGFEQATVEFVRQERVAGKTKFKYWRLWNFALDGITGSTTVPLRIWTYIGLSLACVTLLYAAFVILRTLFFGTDLPGYASLLVVTLIIGSFNFISVGILGEYVGRISEEVRGRPLYIVSETIGTDKVEG